MLHVFPARNLLCVGFLIVLTSTAVAQQTRFFVGLKNGREIPAKEVRMKSPVFGKVYFLVDDKSRYEYNEVA
jgi:hypothetical protein